MLLIVFIEVVFVVIKNGEWWRVELKLLYLMLINVLNLVIGVMFNFVLVIIFNEFLELVINWFILKVCKLLEKICFKL